jgi:hypothetical protein
MKQNRSSLVSGLIFVIASLRFAKSALMRVGLFATLIFFAQFATAQTVFSPNYLDLGVVYFGGTGYMNFSLTNNGPFPITITGATTNQSAMSVEFANQTIRANGGVGLFRLNFTPLSHSGNNITGDEYLGDVTLNSNVGGLKVGYQGNSFIIEVKGEVAGGTGGTISANPARVKYGTVSEVTMKPPAGYTFNYLTDNYKNVSSAVRVDYTNSTFAYTINNVKDNHNLSVGFKLGEFPKAVQVPALPPYTALIPTVGIFGYLLWLIRKRQRPM